MRDKFKCFFQVEIWCSLGNLSLYRVREYAMAGCYLETCVITPSIILHRVTVLVSCEGARVTQFTCIARCQHFLPRLQNDRLLLLETRLLQLETRQ